MQDPTFLIQLAERNLSSGDLTAATRCLEQALAGSLDDGVRAEVARVAEALVAKGGPEVERARYLAVSARGLAPAPTPRAQAEDPVRQLLDSQRELPAAGTPSLPVTEVLTRLLGADLEVHATASIALQFVARATGAVRAHLVLAGRESFYGLIDGPARPPDTSRGILAEVQGTRNTIRVSDAQADPRFAQRESIKDLGVGSVLCVPVLAEDELVGAIYLEAPAAQPFDASHQHVAEVLAKLVGPPLRAGRRYQEQSDALVVARRDLDRERSDELRKSGGPVLVGRSPAMEKLREAIGRFAPGDHSVLIEGESGTGKELVARSLHARGSRAAAPFVAQNMGALTPTMAEAELFGHVKGAFTGAHQEHPGLFRLAHGGTLLLDEIGELDLGLQAKLLRVLQEGEVRPVGGTLVESVDVRVLAATHRDLQAEVAAGRFREDLYYRLSVVKVRVPPLRERGGDVDVLLEQFLTDQAAELKLPVPEVPVELLAQLRAYPWPGNVRQLQNYAVRLLLCGPLEARMPEAPGDDPSGGARLGVQVRMEGDPLPLREARAVFDKEFLRQVLARHTGKVGELAQTLGIHRSYLTQLVKKYDLSN